MQRFQQHTLLRTFPVALSVCFFALICLTSISYASPSPADSVHFSCQIIDPEEWQRDQPLPAAKRLQDLNVGEPRTVRLIYFLPNDRPYRADVVQNMKTRILEIQTFYAEQMAVHGHGNKTFQIETDAQGEPIVHHVDGQHPNSHYSDIYILFRELVFDDTKNVYFILFDGWRYSARGGRVGRNGGLALVREDSDFGVSAHELGHAFGLKHDFRDNAYLMSYGGNQRNSLSACAAEFLAVHPYFNPDIPLEAGPPPTIELISPTEYPADSESVPIRLRVSDSEGLHQVLLFLNDRALLSNGSVKACSGLVGENDAVVEFDYDGVFPHKAGTNLYHIRNHPLFAVAVDTEGNESYTSFTLWSPWEEDSPQHITTLEGRGDIRSVAFSPDGTILAYTGYQEVKLWDVANRTNIATLEVPGASFVNSVAFSPDGTILAYTEFTKIKLWDVAGRTNIATLEGHTGEIKSVVFSPDGTTLASGAADETVKLWDVATRQNVATLVGHEYEANSVVFSPDGTTLASGGRRKILLWDVATRTNIETLEETGIAYTMSFSPDGTMLAFAGATLGSRVITLWDVATRQNIGALVGHESDRVIRSVAFSPDGTTLASGSYDRKVKLWDVATLTNIATLEGHRNGVNSVAFSPDGTVLASASQDETVKLWDTSEWAGPPVVNAPAGICDRTPQVRDAIVAAAPVSACGDVTEAHLASITSLSLAYENITTLKSDDFVGLSALTSLRLDYNDLTTLPNGIFDGLSALKHLNLIGNQFTTLPDGIFDGLSSLTNLRLASNRLNNFPSGIFDGLSALTILELDGNALTGVPESVSGLSTLTHLYLSRNQLRVLPDGVFSGLLLTQLHLTGNSVDPLPLTVSLEKVGEGQFKAVVPTGAPFDIVLPLNVRNGSIDGGATTITIPAGSVESEPLTVTRTSGTTFAATVDIGNLPGLPANHSGYALVKSRDLPLVMTEGTIVIWSATMTVGDNEYGKGWTSRTSLSGDSLSDLDFTFEGHTYRYSLIFRSNTRGSLNVSFASDGGGTIANQATRQKFNFHVGEGVNEKVFNLGEGHYNIVGTPRDHEIRHSSWRVSWNKGDRVTLKITLAPESEWKVISVSDRTPQVRDAIVAAAGVNSASDVTDAHLAEITSLNLGYKSISVLKSGDFGGLSSLTTLYLHNNNLLTSLPEDVFDGLSSLKFLNMQDNGLTSLPVNVFDGLSSLSRIFLYNNELTTLPNGLFEGVTTLQLLHLQGNSVDPLPLTVSLEPVGADQFKAVAPTGASFEIVLPLTVANGSINGGTTTITIPVGSLESEPLTVTRTPGTTSAVTVDIGTLPGLPANHQGYALVKSTDLLLEVISSSATGGQAATDFNGDGKTDFVDFFLFADAYGGTDARFDLDGSGTVDFVDFFKFVDAFGS